MASLWRLQDSVPRKIIDHPRSLTTAYYPTDTAVTHQPGRQGDTLTRMLMEAKLIQRQTPRERHSETVGNTRERDFGTEGKTAAAEAALLHVVTCHEMMVPVAAARHWSRERDREQEKERELEEHERLRQQVGWGG